MRKLRHPRSHDGLPRRPWSSVTDDHEDRGAAGRLRAPQPPAPTPPRPTAALRPRARLRDVPPRLRRFPAARPTWAWPRRRWHPRDTARMHRELEPRAPSPSDAAVRGGCRRGRGRGAGRAHREPEHPGQQRRRADPRQRRTARHATRRPHGRGRPRPGDLGAGRGAPLRDGRGGPPAQRARSTGSGSLPTGSRRTPATSCPRAARSSSTSRSTRACTTISGSRSRPSDASTDAPTSADWWSAGASDAAA